MKYMIVTSHDAAELERKVQRLMDKKGWEPLGGHAVVAWQSHSGMQCFKWSQVLINQGE